ncbi:hypothetical protein M3Y96_01092400 [Aphelenchoides besseyi]|nr:hypothetical protein M3Y96_01092400 [Aphelenchoides besseyi]
MKLIVFFMFGVSVVLSQFIGNNAGQTFCIVTGRQLYSHGTFIRNLNDTELLELVAYKKDLNNYQKALSLVFSNIANMTATLPNRPSLPQFCLSSEMTIYVLNRYCTVQNYKVYVGGKYARDLDSFERQQLDKFAARLKDNSFNAASANFSSNSTETANKNDSNDLTLDFCQEL